VDALEQSGNVRKACHSTWAGEGTVLSVAIWRNQRIGDQQRGGERKLPFSFAYESYSSPLWYADKVWKAAAHDRL